MSLEVFSRGLLLKTDEFKAQLNESYLKESSILEGEMNLRIDEFKKDLDSKFNLELSSRKRSILGSSKSQAQSILLDCKTNLLDAAYLKAKEHFVNLDDSIKKKLYQSLIKKSKDFFDVGKVFCVSEDLDLLKSIISSKIDVVETKDIFGGLIFESKIGDLRIDLSFDLLLEDAKFGVEEDLRGLVL